MREAAGLEEQLFDTAVYYTWYADRWQWTPDQVDNLPWLMQERLRAVATLRDEIAREKQPKE